MNHGERFLAMNSLKIILNQMQPQSDIFTMILNSSLKIFFLFR